MSYVALGVMAVSALTSANKAKNQREQQKRANLAESEQTRYSFATGGPQGQLDYSYVPTSMEAGVGGAIQGAGIAQGLGIGGSAKPTTDFGTGEYANQMKAATEANVQNPYLVDYNKMNLGRMTG